MSTIQLNNCPFCACESRMQNNGVGTWVQCTMCQARGPGVEGTGYEEALLAAEKWNKRGGFGNTRISLVNANLPQDTYKLIERLRDTVERLEMGQLGEPNSAGIVLHNTERKTLHVRLLRMSDLEFNGVLGTLIRHQQAMHKVKDIVK